MPSCMSSRLKSEFEHRPLLWLAMLAVAAVYAVSYASFPVYIDNWLFEYFYIDSNGGSTDFNLGAWFGFMVREYNTENIRLPQILAPVISLHLDRLNWPASIVLGLCTAGMIFLTARLACGRTSAMNVFFIWIVLTVVLPWRNWLAGQLYAINYMPAAFVLLLILYLLRKSSTMKLRYLLPLLFMEIWLHETIGLTLACGMLGYMIMQGFRVGPRWYIATSAALGFALLLVFGAGMSVRIGNEVSFDITAEKIALNLVVHFAFYLLAAAYLLCLAMRRTRTAALELLHDPVFVTAAASAIATTVMNFFTPCQSRYGFSAQLTSVVAAGILLRQCFGLPELPRYARKATATAMFTVMIAFWSCVAWYQHAKYQEYTRMIQCMRQAGGGRVEMEFDYLDKSQPWLLNIPMRNLINYSYNTYCLSRRFPEIDRSIVIVRPDGTEYEHE